MADLQRRPHVVQAEDAHLTEDGIILEVDATLRVRVPSTLLRRLSTLVTMAELAKLMSPEPLAPKTT